MYVCVCNPVTDSQVCQAIQGGCRSLHDLRAKLGLGEGCGRCSEYACELLRNMAHEQKLVVSSAGCKS